MAFIGKAWQYKAIRHKLEDDMTLIDQAAILPTVDSLPVDKVVIQVISAAINPVDYKVPEAPIYGCLVVPRPATPGFDVCGRVVARHPSNTDFADGQLVFGGLFSSATARGMGTLRQYAILSTDCLAVLPEGVSPDQGAAVGTAGTSAYQSLTPGGRPLPAGARVFIHGGSGGVGTWTIQLAKAMGAHVTATCSPHNASLCRSLGADEIVDYHSVDLASYLEQKSCEYDLIVDNVGSDTRLFTVSSKALKANGTFTQVGVGSSLTIRTIVVTAKRHLWPSILGGPRFLFIRMRNSTEYLQPIGEMMAQGRVKAVIDKTFEFEQVPHAYRYLRGGHAKGKIVVKVGE
ncbi:unnamed protein product [Clonostachys solani]|uniref:Enoyl reductase (ER) domain-containing protein n=1 Tax=Clonostachys solani TaxID=160281 RepID=A0A9N9YY88_9HYPO|nr:unnamed protein product [Clonostachys solani]